MNDPWHFARPDDARHLMKTLEIGLVSAIAIVEPRRRGKTTFLLEDLAPIAIRENYIPIYVNLAATTGGLEALIARAISEALATHEGVTAKLRSLRSRRVKKLSGKASITKGELGADLELQPDELKGELVALFTRLAKLRLPVLFLLDEVHRLAEASHHDIAWSLRSLLDSHRKSIKVVATSSSAASYDVMVSGEKRAFKSWFTRVQLTALGPQFVAHLARVVAKHYPSHKISALQITQAFDALGGSPKFIRDYLNERVLNPTTTHRESLERNVIEAANDSGFVDEFARLRPLQRAVLFALVRGEHDLFSQSALKRFERALATHAVTKSLVQRSLNPLAAKGWIIKLDRGEYRIADQVFEQWLNAQVRLGQLLGPQE